MYGRLPKTDWVQWTASHQTFGSVSLVYLLKHYLWPSFVTSSRVGLGDKHFWALSVAHIYPSTVCASVGVSITELDKFSMRPSVSIAVNLIALALANDPSVHSRTDWPLDLAQADQTQSIICQWRPRAPVAIAFRGLVDARGQQW